MAYLQSPSLVEICYKAIPLTIFLSRLATNLSWKAALQAMKLFQLCDTRTLLLFLAWNNNCNANTSIYSFFFWCWSQIKYAWIKYVWRFSSVKTRVMQKLFNWFVLKLKLSWLVYIWHAFLQKVFLEKTLVINI